METSAPATVTITVFPPSIPVANRDYYTITEGQLLTVPAPGVLANDTNADGYSLTAIQLSTAYGQVTLNADGSFTYLPVAGFTGTDDFVYYAMNGPYASSLPSTVTITVVPPSIPVANPDSYTAIAGQTLTVNAPGVLTNDTNADGNALSATLVNSPANGQVALNPDGSFSYTPNNGFTGSDSFTYTASDGIEISAPTTVTIMVAPPSIPVANPDNYAVSAGQTLTVDAPGVLANDTNANEIPLSATLVAAPMNGQLTFNSDGSFSYTPHAGFSGSDVFFYTATDGYFTSEPAYVAITVYAPPLANDDFYLAVQGQTLTVDAPGVLANDIDTDDLPLTATSLGPSYGQIVLNTDGSFSYLPNDGFYGMDSFYYCNTDGFSTSATAMVNIAVLSVPVAVDDTYTVVSGQSLTVTAPGVLANDTNADEMPLSATLVTAPTNGQLMLNDDGSFSYTPNVGFSGTDSFTYTATDGYFTSAPATVSLTIYSVPVANNDAYTVVSGHTLTVSAPGVLANDTNPDGNALSATLVSSPANGQVTLNLDGSFTYIPNDGFWGMDSFTYTTTDGLATSAPATVIITVASIPVANDDAYTATQWQTLLVTAPGVLANDTNADGGTLRAALVTGAANGYVTLHPDGSFTYTPTAGFTGTDSFTYSATDGLATSAPATVTLTVASLPVANFDAYMVIQNTMLTITAPGVLANETDADGHALSATLVSGPPRPGELHADGSFNYIPADGFCGTDSFSTAQRMAWPPPRRARWHHRLLPPGRQCRRLRD